MDILKEHHRESILGVRVDNLNWNEILEEIEGFLAEPKFHQIATVNPEFILEAQKNPNFKEILNSCDLNVTDGFGIKCAFWRYGKNLKCRMAGVDLMMEILKLADKNNLKIFLATRKDGLSSWQETRDAILKIYPQLTINGKDFPKTEFKESLSLVLGKNCILLCNFGAPHQELFINSIKNDSISLAMGVGGSFDFLTGKARRVPRFLRRLGLEWIWRIFQPQPWKFKKERLKRIFRAVIIFPVKVILNRS